MGTTSYRLLAGLFGLMAITKLIDAIFSEGTRPDGLISAVVIGIIAYFFWRKAKSSIASKQSAASLKDHYSKIYAKIEAGELPIFKPQNTYLQPGERAHYCGVGMLLKEQSVGQNAIGAGVRVRVAKGVSVGVGGGQSRTAKELTTIARGELSITDQRVIFAGDLKSFELPLKKITSIQPLVGSMIFHAGSTSHHVQLANEYEPLVAKVTVDTLLKAA